MIDLEQFLRRGETDLSAVVAKVNSMVGLDLNDELLAVGSLVEGLGSCKSDLDILLITSRDGHQLPSEDHIAFAVGKCLIDILILSSSQVEQLVSRLDAWSRAPWNVTQAAKLTLPERTLLHRIANGKALKTPENSAGIRRPTTEDLARLKLHAARQNSRTIQVDMIGYKDEGDYRSLVFAGQEVLGDAVDALLAGHLVTNPLPKWRSRLLESLSLEMQTIPIGRSTGQSVSQFVWRLHRAPELPELDDCLRHALRITTFARRVFVWAELRLNGLDTMLAPTFRNPLERQASDRTLPCLDLDVDYMLCDGQVAVGRLNDFGATLTLTHSEFALCLLFDGTTTAREAELAVYGNHLGEEGARNVERLGARLAAAKFCVETQAEEPKPLLTSAG